MIDVVGADVVPLNDLREHVDGRGCWCAPTVEVIEEGLVYRILLVVHHAQDGRELIEQHGVQ